MSDTEERGERWLAAGMLALFGVVTVLAVVDVVSDVREGTSYFHVALEGSLAVTGLIGAGWMAARLRAAIAQTRRLRERTGELEQNLVASRAEADRWRTEAKELISGLSDAIDRQLERWSLSPAEKDIALLLLKGLSHKEVAALRNVSEATVRQQARALYKKAGLSGRNDLAAFFLEDLLVPRAPVP